VPVTAASANNKNKQNLIGLHPLQNTHSSEIAGFRLFAGFRALRSPDCTGCCAPATTAPATIWPSYVVRDANGQALVYLYSSDNDAEAQAKVLTKDEARRIAVNIARLLELLIVITTAECFRRLTQEAPRAKAGLGCLRRELLHVTGVKFAAPPVTQVLCYRIRAPLRHPRGKPVAIAPPAFDLQ
jgi:hypothetical protein